MLARVENLTQKTTIMRSGKVVDKPWDRFQGLIGFEPDSLGDGLLLMSSAGIESMFTSTPIDVLYVDDSHRVIAVDERIIPNTIGRLRTSKQPQGNYRYVVEVPAGTIARTKTNAGDLLQVVFPGCGLQVVADQFQKQ